MKIEYQWREWIQWLEKTTSKIEKRTLSTPDKSGKSNRKDFNETEYKINKDFKNLIEDISDEIMYSEDSSDSSRFLNLLPFYLLT